MAAAMTVAPGPAELLPPAARTGPVRRAVAGLRPVLFLAVVAAVVSLVSIGDYHPLGHLFEYALRAAVVGMVLVGAAAWWWCSRHGWSWGMELAPALLGGIAGLTLLGTLNGTPFAPGGIDGDQSYRTAAITRFADTWHNADFTFEGLPSFYAPAYFWMLGRVADLGGVDAWRMTKVGTVLAALLVPVVTYLLWRRLVPPATAALIAVVPLLVGSFYQPYSWLVIFAIVPWWLEAVHGIRRPGRPLGNPVLLGLVGALLFVTYYYFFFVAVVALVLHLAVEWLRGSLRRRQVGRPALVLAIAAAGSAVYWLPLALSILRADHPQSLANRWFSSDHPRLPLPMTEASVVGVVALLGLAYLVWTFREALSRGLLVLLVAAYGWYLLGAAMAVIDTPLLSFRGKELVPLILLVAGVLALVRLAGWAATRFSPPDVRRVAWVLGIVLVIWAGQQFVSTVRTSALTEVAHSTALPDGSLPPHHAGGASVPAAPAAEVRLVVDGLHRGEGNPVLLSDRVDIMALYPYFGFLQWSAHYAHPAAEFPERVAFLTGLAAVTDPAELVARSQDNDYDRIDVFVLREDGDELVLRFADDNFPAGTRTAEIRFARELFTGEQFQTVTAGEHLVAAAR